MLGYHVGKRDRLLLAVLVAVAAASISCSASARKQKYLARGNDFFDKHQYTDASLNYRKAIQVDPNFGEAYYKLGLAEGKLNHVEECFTSLSKAAALLPKNDEVKATLGDFYLMSYQAGHSEQAYETANQIAAEILGRNPRSFRAFRLKGYLALADGKPDVAVQALSSANAVQPLVPDVTTLLVQSLLLENRVPEAERLANDLIAAHPDYSPVYDSLYTRYMDDRRLGDAERILLLKVQKNPAKDFPVSQLAVHYFRTNQRDKAESTIQGLLQDKKRSSQPYVTIGNYYRQIGDWQRAAETFDRGADADKKQRALYKKLAIETMIRFNQKPAAISRIDALLRELPNDKDLQGAKATLRVDSPDKDERNKALQELQKLVASTPGTADFRYQLGKAYAADHRYAEARKEYEAVVSAQRDNALAWLSLADMCLKTLDFSAAQKDAAQALALDPKLQQAQLIQASAMVGLGHYQEARTAYTEILRDYPNYREAKLQLALLDVVEGHYPSAEKAFRANYEPGHGDFRALKGLIEMYFDQGSPNRAFELLQSESAHYPNSQEIKSMAATAAARSGNWDSAVKAYEELRAQSPNDPGVLLALGDAYRHRGDLVKASEALLKVQAMRPFDWRAPFLLGYVYQSSGHPDLAEESYRACLRTNPNYPAALNNLAYLLAQDKRRLEEASTFAQKAVKASGGNSESTDTLGWIYLQQGHLDAARQAFASLTAKDPENAMVRYHYGLVLWQKGEHDSARKELQAALHGSLPGPEKDSAYRLLNNQPSTLVP